MQDHTTILQQIAFDRQEKKRLESLALSHLPESTTDVSQKENAQIVNQGSKARPTRCTIQVTHNTHVMF